MSEFSLDLRKLSPQPTETKKCLANKLGSGSYGMVYSAEYEAISVAVKKPLQDLELTGEEVSEFKKEAKVMQNLDHNNIVRLIGFAIEPVCILVMERAEASLYSILQDRVRYPYLPWKLRLSLLRDIARGVQYLHTRTPPILHRDLKAINALLSKNWRVFLTDFGLAKTKLNPGSIGTKNIGTPRWMAPEAVEEDSVESPAMDIYSFGMILYEVLCRQIPFVKVTNNFAIVGMLMKGKRPELSVEEKKSSPDGYCKLMEECWAQDPKDRPQLSDIIKRLNALIEDATDQPLCSSIAESTLCVRKNRDHQESFFHQCVVPSSSSASLFSSPSSSASSSASSASSSSSSSSSLKAESLPQNLFIDSQTATVLQPIKKDEKHQYAEPLPQNVLIDSQTATVSQAIQKDEKQQYVPWEGIPIHSIKLSFKPFGMILNSQQTQLILSNSLSNSIDSYTFDGQELKDQSLTIQSPSGIAMDENHSLYVVNKTHMTLFHFKTKKILSSWSLPYTDRYSRYLTIDQNCIYLTLFPHHQIFLYTKEGKPMKRFGTEKSGTDKCEFNSPLGIITDEKYLYICDCNNHRIQVLEKMNGNFVTQWGRKGVQEGEFTYPRAIYLSKEEEKKTGKALVYVGDWMSVQIFEKKNGTCLQRLGDNKKGSDKNQFDYVYDMCICNGQLYVCDSWNSRVQVFRKVINRLV